jgi:hypothetical protein
MGTIMWRYGAVWCVYIAAEGTLRLLHMTRGVLREQCVGPAAAGILADVWKAAEQERAHSAWHEATHTASMA